MMMHGQMDDEDDMEGEEYAQEDDYDEDPNQVN